MKPAVSVIIAMYNAEKFIADCLSSLALQSFQDFEVIIVDDCSTDNSVAVAQNFSAKFGERLRLAKLSENSGRPGVPRNFALEAARGKYIYFLDSDDLVTETALENLYTVAKKFNADVVHPEKCIAFSDKDGKIISEQTSFQKGDFVTEPTLETFDIGARVTGFIQKKFLWWACDKLFRRKFLLDNRINFSAVSVFEDFVFAFKCLVTAKNYVRVPSVSYCYRVRTDSLSHKTRELLDVTQTMIAVVDALDDFMSRQKFFRDEPRYRYALLDFFMRERLAVISKGFFVNSKLSPAEVFEVLREEIFSSDEHAALTSYLFVATNLFTLKTDSSQLTAALEVSS